MPKNVQITAQLHSSHASKVMLKILQARLQQYTSQEIPDVQAGFRKRRGTRDQIAHIYWIKERKWDPNAVSCTTENLPSGKVNWVLFKMDLEKAEEPESKLSTSIGS